METDKCPLCKRGWRCDTSKPHSTYRRTKVRCPECGEFFDMLLLKRTARKMVKRSFGFPEIVCLPCMDAIDKGQERNGERKPV